MYIESLKYMDIDIKKTNVKDIIGEATNFFYKHHILYLLCFLCVKLSLKKNFESKIRNIKSLFILNKNQVFCYFF